MLEVSKNRKKKQGCFPKEVDVPSNNNADVLDGFSTLV
jgi:hypothetical protein